MANTAKIITTTSPTRMGPTANCNFAEAVRRFLIISNNTQDVFHAVWKYKVDTTPNVVEIGCGSVSDRVVMFPGFKMWTIACNAMVSGGNRMETANKEMMISSLIMFEKTRAYLYRSDH